MGQKQGDMLRVYPDTGLRGNPVELDAFAAYVEIDDRLRQRALWWRDKLEGLHSALPMLDTEIVVAGALWLHSADAWPADWMEEADVKAGWQNGGWVSRAPVPRLGKTVSVRAVRMHVWRDGIYWTADETWSGWSIATATLPWERLEEADNGA